MTRNDICLFHTNIQTLKKKIIRKQNYIFLDDSMEFIIRQIQISLRKNYYCALFKISLIFKTKYIRIRVKINKIYARPVTILQIPSFQKLSGSF